jgi:hypothetical protein
MKQFALLDPTPALLVNVNPRSEKHGKAKVPAVDLRLEITAPNTLLDQLKPELRHALYTAEHEDGPEQPLLDGVDAVSPTPLLRVEGLQPIRLDDELTGYTVVFDIGTGRKDSIVELDGCKVKSFQVEALQGGSVKILLTAQASNLKERDFGKLCMLIDCEVSLCLLPPDEPQQTLVVALVDGAPADVMQH